MNIHDLFSTLQRINIEDYFILRNLLLSLTEEGLEELMVTLIKHETPSKGQRAASTEAPVLYAANPSLVPGAAMVP